MGCSSSGVLTSESDLSTCQVPQHSSRTRILQDDVVDRCVALPPPPEPKLQFLSGDFVDGLLGLCDRDAVLQVLTALEPGQLFQDEDFAADDSSLLDSAGEDVEWLRPHQLTATPHLFLDGTSRGDVKQGLLGDCWFLSACAAVAKRQDLIEKVIDPSQRLFGDGYAGGLLVNFWRFGDWVTVHVDDRLPTRGGHLIYASCTDSSEFWLAVVEKAFAKLHGSYGALAGGHALEAFVDLTGGIAEKLHISPDLFRHLKTMFSHGAFITCSRRSDVDCKDSGLIRGHAYTVTSLSTVTLRSDIEVSLVRIRNPWGDAVEWEGAWSDRSSKWDEVRAEDKAKLKVAALDDGEFWMEFQDFQEQFQDVTVATLGPDFDQDGETDTPRQTEVVKGCWKKDVNAGGCRNDLESFSTNPQYLLSLSETRHLQHNSVIIGLMQEHRRSQKNVEMEMLPLGIFVYKTENKGERLGAEYFLCVPETATSGDFTNSREVLIRCSLESGDYVIIPATYQSGRETNFMLRMFALRPFTLTQLDT